MKKILFILLLYSGRLIAQTETECPFAAQKYVPYDGMFNSTSSYLPENYRQLIQNNSSYEREVTHLDNSALATCFYKTSIHNNKLLKKPFVFVEGISFEKKAVNDNLYSMSDYFRQNWFPEPPLSEQQCLASFNSAPQNQGDFVGYSTFNWATLVTGIDAEGYHVDDPLKVEKSPVLLNKLCCAGYDICFVDFASGEAYIESNGEALYSILVQLHQMLVDNNSTEKMVVCGASMGGLVARYAINKLEAEGHTDWVEKFISFDSPQMGANIPLTLQYTLKHLKGLNQELQTKYNKLICPSASQLVNYSCLETNLSSPVVYTTPTPSIERTEMLNGPYMGWPQHCTKIAISNGSRIGLQQSIIHQPGDKVLDIDGFIDLDLYALPQNDNSYKKVFDFDPPYCLTNGTFTTAIGLLVQQSIRVNNTMALDLSPGSFRKDLVDIREEIPNYITNILGQGLSLCPVGGIDNSVNSDKLCFIPIMSSLGAINYENIMKSNSIAVQSMLNVAFSGEAKFEDPNHNYTHFDVVYAPIENQSHVEITDENIEWVMYELTHVETEIFHENKVLSSYEYKASDKIQAGNNIFNNPACTGVGIGAPNAVQINHCGDVIVLSNEAVYYKAGNFVSLEPGFYTEDNAFFQAEIVPFPVCYSSARNAPAANNSQSNNTNVDYLFEHKNMNANQNNNTNALQALANSVQLIPNPASNYCDINSNNTIDAITVCSVMGTTIETKQIYEKNSRLTTSNFANGVYLIKIETANGIVTKKIVVQHE